MTDPYELIDPELRAALAVLPPLHRLSAETLPGLREAMRGALPVIKEDGVRVDAVTIPGSGAGADVAGLLYRPAGERRRPAMLWLHGGGYVTGSARRDEAACRALAAAHDCVVLSVDYRLAPEAAFPAAHDDAYTALGWLHAQANAIGIDPGRIAVRGNSAGGGIAAGIALRARDEGRYPIALLALVYPMLDDRTAAHPVAGREVWTVRSNRFGWSAYLGEAKLVEPNLSYAVPARAERLAGLPPVWIGCGALDLFVDENIAFAQRLIGAGVPVDLHVYPGAYHGFNLVASAAVSRRFHRDLDEAVGRALASNI